MKKWILIGAVAFCGACASQPEQVPQTSTETKREAYERNMNKATSYTDEEKLESWRARMEHNAQTDTMGDKQKSYDARMLENQNK